MLQGLQKDSVSLAESFYQCGAGIFKVYDVGFVMLRHRRCCGVVWCALPREHMDGKSAGESKALSQLLAWYKHGTPRKLCDVTRLVALGWKAKVDVRVGIEIAYRDFLAEKCGARKSLKK